MYQTRQVFLAFSETYPTLGPSTLLPQSYHEASSFRGVLLKILLVQLPGDMVESVRISVWLRLCLPLLGGEESPKVKDVRMTWGEN
nr:hypothetical protein Iba_chr10dCG8290 [Ipomoea batatas]